MSESRLEIDGNRFHTTGHDEYGWSSDTMEVLFHNGIFAFEINEPWAGDTESGFGQRCDLSLNREQAIALAHWLIAQASGATAE